MERFGNPEFNYPYVAIMSHNDHYVPLTGEEFNRCQADRTTMQFDKTEAAQDSAHLWYVRTFWKDNENHVQV